MSQRLAWPSLDSPLASLLAEAVAPFVIAGLLSPVYSGERFGGQTLWGLVVLWPIGAVLLIVPVLILRLVRTQRVLVVGLIGVAGAGVISMVSVVTSEDAQAGIGFLGAPLLGSVVAIAAVVIDGKVRQRRP